MAQLSATTSILTRTDDMSSPVSIGAASGAASLATVKVWDPFVRLFHWTLLAAFIVAFTSGEEIEWLHLAAGYLIAVLVVLRIIWGFVGPRHARFSDFLRPPRETFAFLRASIALRAPRSLGHNPAGGAMIVVMLTLLIVVSVTGMLLTGDSYWGSEAMEGLHEASVYALIALVMLHLAGVLLTSIEHGENLVRAMITGRKRT
jgi:cytochrome b